MSGDTNSSRAVSGHWQSIITCEGVVFATITGTTEEACTAAGRVLVAGHRMLEGLKAAKEMLDWFMEHSKQADHAHEELGQPLHETAGWKELIDSGYNGRMAAYSEQFDEAIIAATQGQPKPLTNTN